MTVNHKLYMHPNATHLDSDSLTSGVTCMTDTSKESSIQVVVEIEL